MASSLKAFIDLFLASILGISEAAAYERVRALVRLRLIEPEKKRGPGGGVRLTADNVAALIACLAATDNLSDVDQRVTTLCRNKPLLIDKVCSFTGASNFRDALAAIIVSIEKAEMLEFIEVDRGHSTASIGYRSSSGKTLRSSFDATRQYRWSAISTKATIDPNVIRVIAASLSTFDENRDHKRGRPKQSSKKGG